MEKKNTHYKNTILGYVSVIVENSNHNNDLDGQSRMVDGKLIASDKSLKYYVRHYLSNMLEEIFYKKTFNKANGLINSIGDRIFDLGISNIHDFFKCIDNKFFGATILVKTSEEISEVVEVAVAVVDAVEETESKKSKPTKPKKPKGNNNFVFRGPLTVTYAKNIFSNNEYTNHSILNPFPSKIGNEASTIGSETKVSRANYLHSFSFHPKVLERDVCMNQEDIVKNGIPYFTEEEVEKVKQAFSLCIGSGIDSTYMSSFKNNTKIGLVVYVTLKENNSTAIDFTSKIKCGNDFNEYDLSEFFTKVDKYRHIIEKVDIAYTEDVVKFKSPLPIGDDIYNISECGYQIK